MELNYSELIKRDVINVCDGRCLGRIIDVRFSFPKGILVGIIVPGRRRGLFSFFDKSEIYIDRSRIIKIGGDVILVDLKTNDAYAPITDTQEQNAHSQCQPVPPCPPPCPPLCPPSCNPCAPNKKDKEFKQFASICENIDLSDY
jgi:YlmC/YmxH family sporulation protein